MWKTKNEEQKIEAIKAVYESIRESVTDAYTEMGKTLASIADVMREADQ